MAAKFRVGQHVRISKEKMKFAIGSEQNYTTEIFKINKVVYRTPRPVYEMEDLRGQQIDIYYYTEELTSLRITKIPHARWTRGLSATIVSTWFDGKDIVPTLNAGFPHPA